MKATFEQVRSSYQRSIAISKNEELEFSAPWHFHPEFELTYILESNGIRYVGNNIQTFDAGDLVLLGPKLPHCWKNNNNNARPARSIVIQWLPEIMNNLPEFQQIFTLLEKSTRGISFFKETAEITKVKMESMLNKSPIEIYFSLLELLNNLAQEKRYSILAGQSYAYDLSYDTSERLNKIFAFVKANYQEKIRLCDLAGLLNLTEQSFSRFFSKNMNRAFFEYLNEFRINIAARMLMETDKPVAEIGFSCGYETLPFFYKQFKKFKQYSPLVFKRLFIHSIHK